MTGPAQTTAEHTDEALERYLARHRAAVVAATKRLTGSTRRTALLPLLSKVWLKPESEQFSGSFKMRGATNALLRLAGSDTTGVVATSSGNHGRAIARASRDLGVPAVVVIPEDANPGKIAAVRRLGAEVVTEGVTFDNRDLVATRLAEERRWPFVHSSDDWDVIHGQATVAEEICDDLADIQMIVVPVGGGGLLSGTALAVKSRRPEVAVVGVEPAAAAHAAASLHAGLRLRLAEPPTTVADGARVMSLGARPFEVIVTRGLVDEIVTVEESEIHAALDVAEERADVAVEPTAALPMAALLAGKIDIGAGPAALVVSGGNAVLDRSGRG